MTSPVRLSVLFVEDEPLALELISQSLDASGYRVTSFDCPRRALKWFETNANQVDVLITDQSMPELTGIELAQAIRQHRPELPVVLVTGAGSIEHEIFSFKATVLEKPFKKQELFDAIIYVMGEKL